MPVSRKRKKKAKPGGNRGRPQDHTVARGPGAAPAQDFSELARAFDQLTAQRAQIDRQRASRAAALATDLVTDLTRAVAGEPDIVVSDAVCVRLGAVLTEEERSSVAGGVAPHDLAEALIAEIEAAITEASTVTTWPSHTCHVQWRVLTALTHVLPHPHVDAVVEAMTRLRNLPAGRALPVAQPEPDVTGPVLWTSDRYGSRFAVTAPIKTAETSVRWYLWDIDVCGHDAFTVHSAFYPSAEAAFAGWQAGVGETASAGTVLAPATDRSLLASLLPADMGFMRPGGENAEQFAEYHRSKRLAEVVLPAVPETQRRPDTGLTSATAAVEFTAWLRGRVSDDSAQSEDLDEYAEELAESWNVSCIDAVFATCSPHRVALCVLHVRNFYMDDFAEQLVALLPDWVRWLSTRGAITPELADRCLPYAHGRPHPQLGHDVRDVSWQARVIE